MLYDWHEPAFRQLLAGRARRHHALLLVGPGGTGKRALALELARAALCESPLDDGRACGRCKACRWFDDGNHPDFRLVSPAALDERGEEGGEGTEDAGSQGSAPRGKAARAGRQPRAGKPSREIRIEQIRALDSFLEVGAHRAGQRIVAIDPADAMNGIAANALLKRLEEPPAGASFILATSRPASLPATIRSRCQQVSLPMPATDIAVAWLVRESGGSAAVARQWLEAAGGAPLQALGFSGENGAAHRQIVDVLAAMPETGIVATADALAGIDPLVWALPAQTWAADLARVQVGAAPRRHADRIDRLRSLAARTSLGRLTALERRLRALPREAAHPLNARLLLEDVLLEYRRAL
ncbi:MAG: DNA polymerase III subunit delta', partial [Gammaproteobacteria bacterium]